ncbi:MAG: quinol:cytochrome oxidoreductase [Flaviaesturariibacter sp.]|nr:quinol:cytochrome oxidoreductase [Flaviaesturariibacter sp.]
MPIKKFVVGNFYDEQVLFPAIKNVRKTGYKIHDVYTPFPIHGLDTAMGLRDTSLHTAGFIYGITGTATAFSFITWVFTSDWPMNIGGKPFFSLPAWIPIMFELTVLFAAVGMVLTFCYLCQLAPFVKKDHFNLRSTDDTFTMAIELNERSNEQEIVSYLQSVGAQDVSVQLKETGWWLGRYDKEQKLYNHQVEVAG